MPESRTKFYVDGKVQGALARRIIFHWCVFFLLAVVCIFALEYFLGDPSRTLTGHITVIWQKYAFFMLLMVTIIPSFIYDTVKLSNRFVGPMVRLKNSISQVADGKTVDKLTFRKGDFWGDVSDEFNRMTERIKGRKAQS